MKTKTCFLAGISVMALLVCSYAVLETLDDSTSVPVNATTVSKTSSTTTTTAKATTTTTKPAAKGATDKTYRTCKSYCKGIGYDSGECRLNALECRVRLEVVSVYAGRLCDTTRLHTCCCKTGDSVDVDTKYSFGIRLSNDSVSQNSEGTSETEKENIQTVRKVSKPSEEETGYEYTEDYGSTEDYAE